MGSYWSRGELETSMDKQDAEKDSTSAETVTPAGALAGYHLAPSTPVAAAAPATTNLAEIQALKENVVQTRVELAALKVSVDVGNRNAGTQFTRMGERIDRLARDIAPKEATG